MEFHVHPRVVHLASFARSIIVDYCIHITVLNNVNVTGKMACRKVVALNIIISHMISELHGTIVWINGLGHNVLQINVLPEIGQVLSNKKVLDEIYVNLSRKI